MQTAHTKTWDFDLTISYLGENGWSHSEESLLSFEMKDAIDEAYNAAVEVSAKYDKWRVTLKIMNENTVIYHTTSQE